jgi:hypothetical protein
MPIEYLAFLVPGVAAAGFGGLGRLALYLVWNPQ